MRKIVVLLIKPIVFVAFPFPSPSSDLKVKTAVTRTQRDDKGKVYGPEYRVTIHEAKKAVTIDAA